MTRLKPRVHTEVLLPIVLLSSLLLSGCKTRDWEDSSGLLSRSDPAIATLQSATVACRDLAESVSARWTLEITGADLAEEENGSLQVTVVELSPEGVTSYRTQSAPGQGYLVKEETISLNFEGGVLTVRYGLEGNPDDYTGLLSLASESDQSPALESSTARQRQSESISQNGTKDLPASIETREVACRLTGI